VFGTDLDALGLQYLTHVEEALKVLGLLIVLEQVVVDDVVALIVLLMDKHHRGKDSGAVAGFGKALHGTHLREALEAILSGKAGVVGLVG